jgi:hypothetical protein
MTRPKHKFENNDGSGSSQGHKGDNPLLPSINDIQKYLKVGAIGSAGKIADGKTAEISENWKPTLEPDANDFNMLKDEAIRRMYLWTAAKGMKLGLVEQQPGAIKEINAFRHVMTSAIYKLKYGNLAAKVLADVNERRHPEWFSHMGERADSYADRCNNQVGFKIADKLDILRQKGKKVIVDDVVKKAYEAIKEGRCVTNPRETYNEYLRKIEKKPDEIHYRGMD